MTTKKEQENKSRRERVATACLQGLVASSPPSLGPDDDTYEDQLRVRVAVAIDLADELIEQLDEEDEEDGEEVDEDDED